MLVWLRNNIRYIATWQQLRVLGGSLIVKAAIIVPALGYLLLLNTQIVEFLALDERFGFYATNTPWRLALTYYGLTAVGIGGMAFAICCPREVKKYDSPIEYLESEQHYHFVRPARRNHTLEAARALLSRHSNDYHLDPELTDLAEILPNSADQERAVAAYLGANWNDKNSSFPALRLMTAAAFFLGIIILAIPTAWTFGEISLWIVRGFNWS